MKNTVKKLAAFVLSAILLVSTMAIISSAMEPIYYELADDGWQRLGR